MSMLSNCDWVEGLIGAQAEAARPASAMQVTPTRAGRQGMLQDEAYCEALGQAFRAARGTPARAGQSTANAAAPWSEIVAKVQGERQTNSTASTSDDPHGWSSIISQVEREQTQTNSLSSGASSEADRSWTEIIRDMKAKHGLRT